MEDRLKPCPFCGGEADTEWHHGYWGVRCGNCCAEVTADGMDDVIDKWNTRKSMDRIVEQLKEYQRNYSSGLGGFTDELVDRVLRNAIEIVKNGGKDE